MEVIRILQTSGAGDGKSDDLRTWDDEKSAEGIYLDCEAPVNVGAGGAPTAADLVVVLDAFLGLVNVKYKLGVEFQPIQGMKGSQLRTVHRLMTAREVTNDFVGVTQTTGNKTWRFRLFLTPNRQKARGAQRFIGPTQGKTFEISIKEAASIGAGTLTLTRGTGNFVCRIMPAYRIGPDQFSHLPFYREVNRDALDVLGPDGKMLAVYDDNAVFASTQIGKYSLKLGDVELFKQVEPKYANDEYAREIDAGGSNVADVVTPLYVADSFDDERDLPTGACYIKLVTQDVTTLKARFVYLPTVQESEAASVVKAAAENSRSDINAQLPPPPSDPRKNGHQATAPIEFVRRGDVRFESEAGLMSGKDGGQVRVFVPQSKASIAGGLKQADPALLARFQKMTGLGVPGATNSRGKGVGAVRDSVRSAFSHLF